MYHNKSIDSNVGNVVSQGQNYISDANEDNSISQISKSVGKNDRSSNLVYNNENNQINGLFELKNNLINWKLKKTKSLLVKF